MPKSRKTTPAKAAGQPARKTARRSAKPTKPQRPVAKAASSRAPKMRSPTTSARRSKKAAIISLLQRPDGAALGDLTAATGWQVHSVRAALTGLRKEGKELAREKDAAGSRIIDSRPTHDESARHRDRGPASDRDLAAARGPYDLALPQPRTLGP